MGSRPLNTEQGLNWDVCSEALSSPTTLTLEEPSRARVKRKALLGLVPEVSGCSEASPLQAGAQGCPVPRRPARCSKGLAGPCLHITVSPGGTALGLSSMPSASTSTGGRRETHRPLHPHQAIVPETRDSYSGFTRQRNMVGIRIQSRLLWTSGPVGSEAGPWRAQMGRPRLRGRSLRLLRSSSHSGDWPVTSSCHLFSPTDHMSNRHISPTDHRAVISKCHHFHLLVLTRSPETEGQRTCPPGWAGYWGKCPVSSTILGFT